MTLALVNTITGEFIETLMSPDTVVGYDGLNHRVDEPKADLVAAGLYQFIGADNNPPQYKKAQGTKITVGNGVVTESYLYVDMTPEEVNAALDAQIAALERKEILPRITRDMHRMVTLKEAAALGITEADLLSEENPNYSPGYARFYAFDAEIAALRAQRV